MEMTCIVCPRGCPLVAQRVGDSITVTGNKCKKGMTFAVLELTNPMRTICSTVKTVFKETPVLPVRVSTDIPKSKIFDVMKEINGIVVTERISRGDAVIKNVLGLNVDVIATSSVLTDN